MPEEWPLQQAIEHWSGMRRDTPEQRHEAEQFYAEHIFPACRDIVIDRSRQDLPPGYDVEILTLGTTVYPLVFSILALAPKSACLLCTEQTQGRVPEVQRMVHEHPAGAGIPISFRCVSARDPVTVYRAVREELGAHDGSRIAVDVTGGTAAMVTGATQVASVLGADIVYVHCDEYNDELRRPVPGTEVVVLLDDPYEVFGDLREREALQLAARHQYARAAEVLGELNDATAAHVRYELEEAVFRGYAALEELDFVEAERSLGEAERLLQAALKSHSAQPFTPQAAAVLQAQRAWAELLGAGLARLEEDAAAESELLADDDFCRAAWSYLYNYALRRAETGQLDIAALCRYRCLEMVGQRRLALQGLDPAQPDYDLLDADLDTVRKRFAEAQPSGAGLTKELPTWSVNCLNALRLLVALEDEVAAHLERPGPIGMIGKTFGSMNVRNRSIFAHGLQRLRSEEYEEFRDVVDRWADALFAAEGWDADETRALFRFIEVETGGRGA